MARYSKLGLLVKADKEKARTLIELVISQEPSLKKAATKFGVSTQTLRQMSEKCGISVKAEDIDLDAYVAGIAASYTGDEAADDAADDAADAPAKPAKAAKAAKAAK